MLCEQSAKYEAQLQQQEPVGVFGGTNECCKGTTLHAMGWFIAWHEGPTGDHAQW
jgi:hypothetical protein